MEKLILVYGTLKKGFYNHRCLGDSEFVGNVETPPMYTLRDGGFPAVVRGGDTAVKCELYRVTDKETLRDVYNLEGYSGTPGPHNGFYDVDTVETPYGTAEIFVMPEGSWERQPKVESGIWNGRGSM